MIGSNNIVTQPPENKASGPVCGYHFINLTGKDGENP